MAIQVSIDPVLSSRIRAAWRLLSPNQKAQLAPAMLAANSQAVQVAQTGTTPPTPAAPHTLTLATSALSGDRDAVVSSLDAATPVIVGPDGVIWGTGKWEQFDPGWVEAFAVYLENQIVGPHPFVNAPQTIQIDDNVTIGMAGDWGTGEWRSSRNPAPSTDVGSNMKLLNLDITIHLGDVYYSGTADQELHLLTAIWPAGRLGSFALNSNHEMYSGAKPYYNAINSAPFNKQAGCSYFALENKNWVIVGLDSAYFSPSENLYMDGRLFPDNMPNEQNAFLLQKSSEAQLHGKKLIVLTHHNSLNDSGNTPNILFEQVMNACPAGAPAYWYYGHEHIGAVYKPVSPSGVMCRCCGHGALPWGRSSDLANSTEVIWYEKNLANDPDIPQRVFNGFAVLSLDGPNIQEKFYNENGAVTWQSP